MSRPNERNAQSGQQVGAFDLAFEPGCVDIEHAVTGVDSGGLTPVSDFLPHVPVGLGFREHTTTATPHD